MTYLQLRITLDPSGNRSAPATFNLLRAFVREWLFNQDPSGVSYTTGVEKLNKFGEPCDEHFHFNAHFDPPDLKDPLRSAKNWLRKKALAQEFNLKGNKVWSCTIVEEPNDWERWIRYPLKEKPIFELSKLALHYSPEGGIQQLARDAQNERKRGIELNVIKREKAMDKQSFKDKLFKYLDSPPDGGDHPKTHCSVWIAILQYYMEQGKAVCYKTITGYTDLYLLHKGLKTPLEAYAQAMGQKVVRSNPQ